MSTTQNRLLMRGYATLFVGVGLAHGIAAVYVDGNRIAMGLLAALYLCVAFVLLYLDRIRTLGLSTPSALGSVSFNTDLRALLDSLESNEPALRWRSIRALRCLHVNEPDAVGMISDAMISKHAIVRAWAAKLLGQAQQGVPNLLNALGDENNLVRIAACDSLKRMGYNIAATTEQGANKGLNWEPMWSIIESLQNEGGFLPLAENTFGVQYTGIREYMQHARALVTVGVVRAVGHTGTELTKCADEFFECVCKVGRPYSIIFRRAACNGILFCVFDSPCSSATLDQLRCLKRYSLLKMACLVVWVVDVENCRVYQHTSFPLTDLVPGGAAFVESALAGRT